MHHTSKNTPAILCVIAFSSFLATLNETILNVALDPLMKSFAIDYGSVQWVVTLNMLVIAVMIPVAGYLSRILPTRTLVIGSLAVTLAGSVLGAFATSFPLLLVARAVQAAGTGVTMPVTMALTLIIAPKHKLGTYMGIVSVMTTLGPSFGPITAGFALGATDDWHVLFCLFGGLTALVLAGAVAFIPNATELERARLDVPSVVGVSIALVGVMYGITALFGGQTAVGAASLIVGCVALGLFVRRQRRIDNPLVDLRPFAKGGFRIGCAMLSLAFMTTFSMNIVIPLFLQGAMAQSAFSAALILLPATIFSTVASPLGGRIYDRFGVRVLLPLAFVLIICGTLALAQVDAATSTLFITLVFIPVVIGTGIGVSPSQSFALSRLEQGLSTHGVTIVSVCLQIAGCIGSSMFVGIMSAVEGQAAADGAGAAAAQAVAFDTTCYAMCAIGVVGLCLALYAGRKVAARTEGHTEPTATPDDGTQPMRVADLLGPDRVSVPADASAFDALQAMATHRTGGLALLNEDDTVAGFMTDGDVMRYLAGGDPASIGNSQMYAWWRTSNQTKEDLEDLRQVKAIALGTQRALTVDAGADIDALIRLLSDVRIKRVPVTRKGHYLGTLHRSDLVAYLVESAQK